MTKTNAKTSTALSATITEIRLGAGATTWSVIARAAKTHTQYQQMHTNLGRDAEIAGVI